MKGGYWYADKLFRFAGSSRENGTGETYLKGNEDEDKEVEWLHLHSAGS